MLFGELLVVSVVGVVVVVVGFVGSVVFVGGVVAFGIGAAVCWWCWWRFHGWARCFRYLYCCWSVVVVDVVVLCFRVATAIADTVVWVVLGV